MISGPVAFLYKSLKDIMRLPSCFQKFVYARNLMKKLYICISKKIFRRLTFFFQHFFSSVQKLLSCADGIVSSQLLWSFSWVVDVWLSYSSNFRKGNVDIVICYIVLLKRDHVRRRMDKERVSVYVYTWWWNVLMYKMTVSCTFAEILKV